MQAAGSGSTASDEFMNEIYAIHDPDGREIDVKPLFHLVEDIFSARPSIDSAFVLAVQAQVEALEDKMHQAGLTGTLEALAYTIDRLSCEKIMTQKYEVTGGSGSHDLTISVFKLLSSYSWDAKLVLAISAFAVNYGELWLVAQFYDLKKLPESFTSSAMLKYQYNEVKNLIELMLDITSCIVELKQYSTVDEPIAVYWAIRTSVVCARDIAGLTDRRHEYHYVNRKVFDIASLPREPSSLAYKVSKICTELTYELAAYSTQIDDKRLIRAYQTLLPMFETRHTDNTEVFKRLIYAKDVLQPLVDGFTKRRVGLGVLSRKTVLLLISDLDISQEELLILQWIYSESRNNQMSQESHYEFVWLPILDQSVLWRNKLELFESLQARMPWYTVQHPSFIGQVTVKFIKDVWHFEKKPIAVVIDPYGQVGCPNALHMMWIWGSLAFPFTASREEALWKEETWRLELLVNGFDPLILNWIQEGRFICLYGGQDIEWIRNFTTTARNVLQAADISMEMVYVGKSNPDEQVQRNIAIITAENLSYCWQDLTLIWFFWDRIDSMRQSKMHFGRTVKNDFILQEVVAMLSFDSSDGGWALFSKGSAEMVQAKGSMFLTCLSQYGLWKEQAQQKGFLQALKDHILQL